MDGSLLFLLGLLERGEPAFIAWEDWQGEHADTLRLWQDAGFLDREPGSLPVPSCPRCGEGTPYRLGTRLLCNACRSAIDPRHLSAWRLRLPAVLEWVARRLNLRGGVHRIDDHLWQLGTLHAAGEIRECFFRGNGPITDEGRGRMAAFRQALVFFAVTPPREEQTPGRTHLGLVELLRTEGGELRMADPLGSIRPCNVMRFDESSGALWSGDVLLGEVPAGSRECHLLGCLAQNLDRYVPYADLKREVLARSGGSDERDDAGFCHRLKARIKKRFIPRIDQYVVTANKGEGYRLRAAGER